MSAVARPQVLVRPMRERDVAWVCAIEQEAYPYPWSKGIFRDCLRVGYSCWTAQVDGRVAGYGILSVPDDEAHILNLCVAPDLQGQGIGRVLLSRLLQAARYHRAKGVFLEVRPTNFNARRLYDRAGFVEVGRRPRYYPGGGEREDALVMALRLRPPIRPRAV